MADKVKAVVTEASDWEHSDPDYVSTSEEVSGWLSEMGVETTTLRGVKEGSDMEQILEEDPDLVLVPTGDFRLPEQRICAYLQEHDYEGEIAIYSFEPSGWDEELYDARVGRARNGRIFRNRLRRELPELFGSGDGYF